MPSLTPLRRSTCYALLSLADPQPGDVVLDSMAGCAGISIEGAESFPSCFHIAAELSMSDCLNSRHNIRALRASAADVWNSDARYLPLKDGSVDAVIVDLPFGNRHGSHAQNTRWRKCSCYCSCSCSCCCSCCRSCCRSC